MSSSKGFPGVQKNPKISILAFALLIPDFRDVARGVGGVLAECWRGVCVGGGGVGGVLAGV